MSTKQWTIHSDRGDFHSIYDHNNRFVCNGFRIRDVIMTARAIAAERRIKVQIVDADSVKR